MIGIYRPHNRSDFLLRMCSHMRRVHLRKFIDCNNPIMVMIDLIKYLRKFLPLPLTDIPRRYKTLQRRNQIITTLHHHINT